MTSLVSSALWTYLPKLSGQALRFGISLKKKLHLMSVIRGLSQSSCRLLHAVFICTQSLCMQSFAICLIFQWQFISLFFIASWHGYVPFWLEFACQMTVAYYFYFSLKKKISLKRFYLYLTIMRRNPLLVFLTVLFLTFCRFLNRNYF